MDISLDQEKDIEKVNSIVNSLNKDLITYLNIYQASPDVLYNVIPKFANNSFEMLIKKLEIEKMNLTDQEIRDRIVSFLENIALKLLLTSERIILDVINKKSCSGETAANEGDIQYH